MFQFSSEQYRVKVGLAEMLKGGVIMDVTNAEQARIAQDAGASAVMALERVPSDIRKKAVWPVWPYRHHGRDHEDRHHPGDGQGPHRSFHGGAHSGSAGRRLHRRKRSPDPGDEEHHIDKNDFKIPFVCGARIWEKRCGVLARALHDPNQGRGRFRQYRGGGSATFAPS